MDSHLPNSIFLTDGRDTYTYADLFGFAHGLKRYLQQEPPNVLIPGIPDPGVILTIAACYLLNQPVLIFRPDNPESVKNYASEGSLLIHPNSTVFRDDELMKQLQAITPGDIKQSRENTPPARLNNLQRAILTLFTSGTTGQPKPVYITRNQLESAVANAARNFRPASDEMWLLCLPLFHMGGLGVIYRSLSYGSGIYSTGEFNAERCANTLNSDAGVRYASLVPTQLRRMLALIKPDKHHLKAVLVGGGPISATLLEQAKVKNVPAIGSYGMTETCGQIFAQPLNSKYAVPSGSAGRIFHGNRVQIRALDDETVLPAGQTGGIFLKGNQIPDPLLNPQLCDRYDSDGWFATADMGHLDANGNLYVDGRRDDVILTGGENVIPNQVEEVLAQFDSLGEVAITGLPDDEWGQRVVAVYTGKLPDKSILEQRIRLQLPAYALPKEWIKVDTIPKNDMGKVERKKLRLLI